MMNPLLKSVGNRMFGGVENNRRWPRTLFQTYLQQKDLKLAIETAEKVNCEVPIASARPPKIRQSVEKGHASRISPAYETPTTKKYSVIIKSVGVTHYIYYGIK